MVNNTVLDFWKMAKILESKTIVLLCDLTENTEKGTFKTVHNNYVTVHGVVKCLLLCTNKLAHA